MPSDWAEPLSAIFWRMRVQTGVVIASIFSTVCLSFFVVHLAHGRTALVYAIEQSGRAQVIREWIGQSLPSDHEAAYVASLFVERLYGRNSSTVHEDLAQAISMCSTAMQKTLRDELASMGFVDRVRAQEIRSETVIDTPAIKEQSQTHFIVTISGETRLYPLTRYDGDPAEKRPFHVNVGLRVVERDPTHRRNGLEIVSLSEVAP